MSKILVFGDSIAYGKWDIKGGWVARLRKYVDKRYNLENPQNLQVYNLGIPGEVATRLADRFEKELKDRVLLEDAGKNNLVVLAIGINDSCPNNWMTEKQTPESEFKDSMRSMIQIAKKIGCEVVIVGLTPVDSQKNPEWGFTNEEVKKYDSYLSQVAKDKDVKKLELFEELVNLNFSEYLVDAVHPGEEGHELLADKIVDFINSSTRLFGQ